MVHASRLCALLVMILVSMLPFFTPNVSGQSLVQVGTLQYDQIRGFSSAAIDNSGFAYFTGLCCVTLNTYNNNIGTIVRIQLSTFSPAGVLKDAGTDPILIDEATGFAYVVGEELSPPQIFKIRLTDFSVVGENGVDGAVTETGCALMDSRDGFAYFAFIGALFTDIARVRLSDFSISQFTVSEDDMGLCLLDSQAGFAYFGTRTVPAKVFKIRLSDFTREGIIYPYKPVAVLTLGVDYLASGVIDTVNGFAYFGTGQLYGVKPGAEKPGAIVKIRLSDFSLESMLTLGSDENYVDSAVIDVGSGFAYFRVINTITHFGSEVVKVRLSDFSRVETLALSPGETGPGPAVMDTRNGYIYFGTGGLGEAQPAEVVKVSVRALPEPTESQTVTSVSQVSPAFVLTSDTSVPIGVILGLLISIPIVIFRSRRLRSSS